jgi:hypothetical protein
MNETFRPKRSLFYLGLIGFVFFSLADVLSIAVAVSEARPDRRVLAAMFFGACWTPFVLLSLYLLIASLRERLSILGSTVESEGVLTRKRIALDEVTDARWRRYGKAGRLVLRSAWTKVAIDFDTYETPDRRRLILFLREMLPTTIQQGWDTYWTQYWSTFDEPEPAMTDAFAQETRALRRRLDVWFALGVVAVVVLAFSVRPLIGLKPLAGIIPIALLWLICRWGVSVSRGKVRERLPPPDTQRPIAVVYGGMTLLMLVQLGMAWLNLPGGKMVLTVGTVALCIMAIVIAWRIDKRMKPWRQSAARSAADEYLKPDRRPSASDGTVTAGPS